MRIEAEETPESEIVRLLRSSNNLATTSLWEHLAPQQEIGQGRVHQWVV